MSAASAIAPISRASTPARIPLIMSLSSSTRIFALSSAGSAPRAIAAATSLRPAGPSTSFRNCELGDLLVPLLDVQDHSIRERGHDPDRPPSGHPGPTCAYLACQSMRWPG